MQLASMQIVDAAPAIMNALHEERIPHVRVVFASALSDLDVQDGQTILTTICANNETKETVRLRFTYRSRLSCTHRRWSSDYFGVRLDFHDARFVEVMKKESLHEKCCGSEINWVTSRTR
jgi:hypothetical protein